MMRPGQDATVEIIKEHLVPIAGSFKEAREKGIPDVKLKDFQTLAEGVICRCRVKRDGGQIRYTGNLTIADMLPSGQFVSTHLPFSGLTDDGASVVMKGRSPSGRPIKVHQVFKLISETGKPLQSR